MSDVNEVLNKLDIIADKKYFSLALPHADKTQALWYFLVVLEDQHIWMFRSNDSSQQFIGRFGSTVDLMKYSMKHGLSRIRKELRPGSDCSLPKKVISKSYSTAATLLDEGMDYSNLVRMISALYDGKIKLLETEDAFEIEVIDTIYHDDAYSVLEVLGHKETSAITYSQIVRHWVTSLEDIPEILVVIGEAVSIDQGLISYDYNQRLVLELAKHLAQQPYTIPDEWVFPWGGRTETTLLLNSLCLRCLYHIVSVEYGARSVNLAGGGHESLVLILNRKQLILDIAALSSQSNYKINKFLDFITYGLSTESPDPALQPLIKLSGGRFAIPCFHIITSHLERNILSLQARIFPKEFDSLSKLFEVKMVNAIVLNIESKWPSFKVNVNIQTKHGVEEIDLMIADPESNTLVVCELRWMLPPGDPREVQNKKKTCYQKISQLNRKINKMRPCLGAIIEQHFGISNEKALPWNLYGIVVIEGFGGARSNIQDIPVMAKQVFETGLGKTKSLRQFGEWSRMLDWLPKEEVHFNFSPAEIETPDKPMKYRSLELLVTPEEYRKHVEATLEMNGHK
jgi:hypothetical protein